MGQSPACREGPRGGRRQLVFCLTALHVCLSVSSVVLCVGHWRRSQPELETEAERLSSWWGQRTPPSLFCTSKASAQRV